MTVNLSNNTKTRAFSADTPPKLSENYERATQVENQIREALLFSEPEFSARLTITNFQTEQFLSAEALVCLLSLAHAGNLPQTEDLIAERLAVICEKRVRKFLQAKDYDENFIEEAVGEIVFQMFAQILGRNEKSYDFWEVRFYVALNRLIKSFVRKHGEKSANTKLFSEMSDAAGGDEEFDFESNAGKFEALTTEEKLEVKEVLAKMPDEHRKIFILYHIDEWTQEEIAEIFGITARTVRNRLKQIKEFLTDFRNLQGGGK